MKCVATGILVDCMFLSFVQLLAHGLLHMHQSLDGVTLIIVSASVSSTPLLFPAFLILLRPFAVTELELEFILLPRIENVR